VTRPRWQNWKKETKFGLQGVTDHATAQCGGKMAEKWQKCNLVSGMASVASNMG